ncbi:MAG: ABC transporter substrate-binding protein [bacterium]
MSNQSLKSKLVKYLVFISFCLAFSFGCGGSKKPSSGNSEKVSLRLNGGLGVEYAGYYVAVTKGYYADEGLEVRLQTSDWEDRPEESVLNGTETFGVTWLPELLIYRDKGKPVVNIAQIFQKSGLKIIAKKSKGINLPTDFMHKRLGIWPEPRDIGTMTFLTQAAGLDAKIVQLIPQKKTIKPFIDNQVDAIPTMGYDGYLTLLEKGVNTTDLVVFDASTSNWGLLEDGIFTTDKTVQEQPELCQRFLHATLKGWQYAIDNPGETVEIILSYDKQNIMQHDQELVRLREIIKLIKPTGSNSPKLGYLDPAEFNHNIDLLRKHGYLTQDISATAYTHAIWEKSSRQ